MTDGFRIGSLCSGYGGLDMAAEALTGGRTVWVSDVDKGANKILAHRYPDVPNLGDFTKVKWTPDCPDCGHELRAVNETPGSDGYIYWCPSCSGEFPVSIRPDDMPAPIDMLTAGYPCQPFSHAGKRAGTNDARHLWPEVLRCLTTLRPPFALFENVRGHLSLGFDQVLADLATHDYDARWIVLRAADIGAPHGRARLFILAADARRGGDRWDLVGAGRGAVRVGGVRGEGAGGGGDEGRADLLGDVALMPTPQAADASGGRYNSEGHQDTLPGVARLLPTPTTSDTNGAGAHGDGGTDLRTTVARMLPTPTSRDWKDHTIRREPHRPDDTDTLARALTDVPCALLPTPAVNDMGAAYTPETWDAWTEKMKAEHGNGNGHGKSLSIEAQRLLPTPTTQPTTGNGHARHLGGEARLLQTPSVSDSSGGHANRSGDRAHELLLPGQAREMHGAQWGDYAPAIHRWEAILGRPAPAPTMTSAKGNPQLSPRFVEWMMGLPEGWVDDVPDLSRNEKLKALGNGVVSQQAVEAVLRLLALGERVVA